MGVEYLAENHNVTVVLRLVVTASGRLVHGELVEPDGSATAMFLDWNRLVELLQEQLLKS
jgi:hypothetical protein